MDDKDGVLVAGAVDVIGIVVLEDDFEVDVVSLSVCDGPFRTKTSFRNSLFLVANDSVSSLLLLAALLVGIESVSFKATTFDILGQCHRTCFSVRRSSAVFLMGMISAG